MLEPLSYEKLSPESPDLWMKFEECRVELLDQQQLMLLDWHFVAAKDSEVWVGRLEAEEGLLPYV